MIFVLFFVGLFAVCLLGAILSRNKINIRNDIHEIRNMLEMREINEELERIKRETLEKFEKFEKELDLGDIKISEKDID